MVDIHGGFCRARVLLGGGDKRLLMPRLKLIRVKGGWDRERLTVMSTYSEAVVSDKASVMRSVRAVCINVCARALKYLQVPDKSFQVPSADLSRRMTKGSDRDSICRSTIHSPSDE